jgi:hypothetical protein
MRAQQPTLSPGSIGQEQDGVGVLLVTVAAGLAAVVALKLVTLGVESLGMAVAWQPSGRPSDRFQVWSIAVALVLVLAAVTAGWTALILHSRAHRRWRAFASAAAAAAPAAVGLLVGLGLALPGSGSIVPLGGPSGAALLASVLVGGALLFAPLVVAVLVPAGAVPPAASWRWHVVSGVVWTAETLAGAWLLVLR